MKKTQKTLILLLVAMVGFFSSCKEYYDDMENLGERVVKLEESALDFTNETNRLTTIVGILSGQNQIKNVYQNADGIWVIEFDNDSLESILLHDGAKGATGDAFDFNTLGVRDSTNGRTYWTSDGDWILDANGNPVELIVVNGQDATSVDPRTMDNVPVIRINSITGEFEYTTDTQYDPSTCTWRPLTNAVWITTGAKAKGQPGETGETGDKGESGVITINKGTGESIYSETYIKEMEDGMYLVFVTSFGSFGIKIENVINPS